MRAPLAALLGLQQGGPAVTPPASAASTSLNARVRGCAMPRPLHQRGLRGLAEFEREGSRAIKYARASQFERTHQGKAERHGARIAAHIGAGAGLVEVQRRFRQRCQDRRPLVSGRIFQTGPYGVPKQKTAAFATQDARTEQSGQSSRVSRRLALDEVRHIFRAGLSQMIFLLLQWTALPYGRDRRLLPYRRRCDHLCLYPGSR